MRVRTFSKQVMKQTESSDKYGEKINRSSRVIGLIFISHFKLHHLHRGQFSNPVFLLRPPDVFKRLLHLNICSYLTPCIKKTMKDLTSAHLSFLIHIKPSPPPERILTAKTKQKRKMKRSFGEGREKIWHFSACFSSFTYMPASYFARYIVCVR